MRNHSPRRLLRWIPAFAGMVVLLAFSTAHAADYTYAPAGCEFQMVFPEEPLTQTRCKADEPEKCTTLSTYNRVLDIDSAIRITASCNKAEDGMLERYSGEVMEFTLAAMAKDSIDDYETSFVDHGDAKEAMVLGGRDGDENGPGKIYMAHLWIGKNSILTVEGEVTGSGAGDADAAFIAIMKTIGKVGAPQQQVENKEKTDTSAAPAEGE